MTRRLRAPSPAFVIALIALFVALGGTTYAAVRLPRNSVGTAQLRNGAVTKKKIQPKTLGALKGQVGPQGPQGPQGTQGQAGAPGATNVVSRKGTAVAVDPGTSALATATCAQGETVVGGGGNGSQPPVVLWASVPSPPGVSAAPATGWTVTAYNTDSVQHFVIPYVMCASP